MPTEEWIVQARLAGEFFISDERRESSAPLVEGLRSLSMAPQFNDDGQWNGLHELEATLSLDNQNTGPIDADVALGRGKHLVDNVTDLASLSIGRPVRVEGGVSVKHRIGDDPAKYRFITGVTDAVSFGPPAPLIADVLTLNLEPRIQRVVRWWSRGVGSIDPVDRLLALSSALDLLAGTVEGPPSRLRRCEKCDDEQTIGPGLRERVVHFLSCELKYDQTEANEIYESRIDVAHARSDLREEDLRRFRAHADTLASAVRRGIEKRIGLDLPTVPVSLPIDVHSALLDIEYIDGENPE